MPFYKRLNINELSWLTVDLTLPEMDSSAKIKSLKEVCLEKLVSDVCLFRNLSGMPKFIHSMLLSTALAQHRTLSISQLMKYSPYKELKLPIPAALRHWESVIKPGRSVKNDVEKYMDNAITMLSTYLCLIEEGCTTTQLEVLDLGYFPWGASILETFCSFVMNKNIKKEYFSKISMISDQSKDLFSGATMLIKMILSSDDIMLHYSALYIRAMPWISTNTLKCAFTFESDRAAEYLLNAMKTSEALGLKLVVTGLECHNCKFMESEFMELAQTLDPSDFVNFTLNFAKVVPSIESFVKALPKFQDLKFLNFSYQASDFSTEPLLSSLAISLTELPHLSRLILQGNKLRGCTETLFQKYCKKNSMVIKKSKTENESCCLVHNGTLEFLDISACKLINEDILFLREMPLASTLKYLNIDFNSFSGKSGYDTLLALKSNLVVLEMDKAFSRYPPYDAKLFPFSSFTMLRYLNMKGMELTTENFGQFLEEREKCPNLIIHKDELNEGPEARFDWTNIQLPPDLFFLVPD